VQFNREAGARVLGTFHISEQDAYDWEKQAPSSVVMQEGNQQRVPLCQGHVQGATR